MSFRFQRFPLYSEIRMFIQDVYVLSQKFPKEEQFGLKSQLNRAATSVLLNIAEGSMRGSDAELNRFLLISVGSMGEIIAILDICLDLKYITPSKYDEFVVKCDNIVKQLQGFRRKINKN